MQATILIIRRDSSGNWLPPETYDLGEGKLTAVIALLEEEDPPMQPSPWEELYVTGGINLRSAPGVFNRIIGDLQEGDVIQISGRHTIAGWDANWSHVIKINDDPVEELTWCYLARTRAVHISDVRT